LTQAAAAGELMAQANSFAKRFDGSRYWPDRQWDLVLPMSNSDQRGDGYDELLERTSWFYEAVTFSEAMKSQTPGKGQAYLSAYTDADGNWLDGAASYTLHVPANPPAKLFWSATVYDAASRCLIDNDQQRGDRGSRNDDLRREADGSVNLYFDPSAPAGRESNWVQTIPGRHWFCYVRLYGPLEPYFDRSWKLGDIHPGTTPQPPRPRRGLASRLYPAGAKCAFGLTLAGPNAHLGRRGRRAPGLFRVSAGRLHTTMLLSRGHQARRTLMSPWLVRATTARGASA
jgi:hypothetical protein